LIFNLQNTLPPQCGKFYPHTHPFLLLTHRTYHDANGRKQAQTAPIFGEGTMSVYFSGDKAEGVYIRYLNHLRYKGG
jgi:hypothetical protein